MNKKKAISNQNLHLLSSKPSDNSTENQNEPFKNISYTIVHKIPGRIRFRIHRLLKDSEYATQLKQIMESDSQITSVRVNQQAASIVVNYKPGIVSDAQMQLHLVELIQLAPSVKIRKPITIKSVLANAFDAGINLIDSLRNINKARNAIVHKPVKNDIWERLLTVTKTSIKGLKSTILFILPNKRVQDSNKLQPI
jgi:Heavy metal associated domain 2